MSEKPSEPLFHPEQSWTCEGCGECCGMWDIPVTKEEKERLEKLDLPGFDFDKNDYFTKAKKGRGIYFIKKKDDKCVFLDSDGLCVIHKKHGEKVKALACRLYPFHVLNWRDGKISASFRFDCQAVSRGNGQPISKRKKEIRSFAKELRPGLLSNAKYNGKAGSSLADMRKIAAAYAEVFSYDKISLAARLHYAVNLLDFNSTDEHSGFVEGVDDSFAEDAMEYMRENGELFEAAVEDATPPDKLRKMIFNYLLTGFVRVDEMVAGKSLIARVPRARKALAIVQGKGSLRDINPKCAATSGISPLDVLAERPLSPETERIVLRHASAQLAALHFCGKPGPGLTFEEGMRHLVLMQAVTCAITAMFEAADERDGAKREHPAAADAIRVTDHTFYHSPFFALGHVKKMTRWLVSPKTFPSIARCLKSPLG